MISKELLSEVLGYKVFKVKDLKDNRNNISFDHETQIKDGLVSKYNFINIHEIDQKCKEWAIKKGYTVVESPLMIRISDVSCMNKIWEYSIEEQKESIYFKPEYTFKACQWILEQGS